MTDLLKAIDLDALLRLAEATSRHGESLEKWKVRAQFTEAALKAVPVLVARLARSEERVKALEMFLVAKGYHASGPDCYHGMAHWLGDRCAFACALLDAVAAPEQQAPQGESGWCPNTSLRIPQGECGCCPDPDAPGAATPAGGEETKP